MTLTFKLYLNIWPEHLQSMATLKVRFTAVVLVMCVFVVLVVDISINKPITDRPPRSSHFSLSIVLFT